MTVAMTPRTNRVKQRLAQAAATPRRVREDPGRQMTPRDILRALSRVMVKEKKVEEETRGSLRGMTSGSHEEDTNETQDGSPTSARSRTSGRLSGQLSARLSGRLSDATGMMGRLSMASPTAGNVAIAEGDITTGTAGDVSMVSARSVELQRRVSYMSRLSNATRISDIFHTTNGAEDEEGDGKGGQTPLTPFRAGEMLPEMDLEFGEEIGMGASSDEDFGGHIIDYDEDEEQNEQDIPELEGEGAELGGADVDAETPFSPPPEDILIDDAEVPESSQPVDTPVLDANVELDSPEEEAILQDDAILFSDEDVANAQPSKKPTIRRPRKKRTTPELPPSIFPRPFLKSLVASITGDSVDKSVIEELVTSSDMFFDQAADDLTAYADHCKRKRVEPKDVVQLMRRQRLINDSSDVLPLAQRHLPAELIAELSDVFTIRAPKRRKSKKDKGVEQEQEQEDEEDEEGPEDTFGVITEGVGDITED